MQSFLLLVNILLCSIVLLHLLSNENGLVNAMPALNGGDELLLRKKRQDEGDEAGDAANENEGGEEAEENAGGDNAENGNEENNGEGQNEENNNGEENNEEEEGTGEENENQGGQQQGGGGTNNGRGNNRGNENGGQNGNGQQQQQPPAGGATCTNRATGCDVAYCGNTDFARAHCAGTCRSFLNECSHLASVPDPSVACGNPAGDCAMNPNVCSDDVLAVCGCPRKCGRCSDHTTYIMQGKCRNVL